MITVLRNGTYRALFFAQVIALVGTGLLTVALGLLAFEIAGDAAGSVLGTALTIKPREVQRRLHGLMRGDREPIDGARRRLRSRLVVPVAGILVACTAVGALLFERAGDSASEPATPAPSADDPGTGVARDLPLDSGAEVEIGDAAVLVRPSAG